MNGKVLREAETGYTRIDPSQGEFISTKLADRIWDPPTLPFISLWG